MIETGIAKTDITAFKPGIGMMGYGMFFNKVEGQDTPLHARAFVFQTPESGKKVAIVVCEMAFVTASIKRGVLKKLNRHYPEGNFSDDNILMSAQHTHSGPGGYSHYGFYNLTIPGFVLEVYQQIVSGIFEAIVAADKNRKKSTLKLAEGEFPAEQEVAFNRSIKAYLANPDVAPLSPKDTHLAVDRTMRLLRIEGENGQPFAAINWFGLHTTNLHNDNRNINWDNKGYAADFLEKEIKKTPDSADFIGAFAQAPAGDVTPNYRWDKKRKWTAGKFESDIESAQYNGKLQFEKALELLSNAQNATPLSEKIDYGQMFVNFAHVEPHPDFTGGVKGARTGPACHGVSFFAGTVEGPGMPAPVSFLARRLSEFMQGYEYFISLFQSKEKRAWLRKKYKIHGRKHILIEAGERKILATRDVKNLIIPGFADPSLKNFKKQHRMGALDDKPWTPQVLPLQIVLIGELAIAAVPGEPTTVAGRRLRKMLLTELAPRGIQEVIIAPYANAYCGYITTYEEYQLQCYEGGHTVFGEWTLAALMTKFRELAREMVKEDSEREFVSDVKPVTFTKEELEKRSYAAHH